MGKIKIIAFDLMEVILRRDEPDDPVYQDMNKHFDLDDAGFYPWAKEKYGLNRKEVEKKVLGYMQKYYHVLDKTIFDLEKEYPFALATDHLSIVLQYMKIIGIKKYFRWIVNSSKIGVRKQNPRFYETLLDKIKKKPEEILYIDDYVGNIKTAKRMDFRVLHFNADHKQTNLRKQVESVLSQ